MGRPGFRLCGYDFAGTPSLSPLNGWFWNWPAGAGGEAGDNSDWPVNIPMEDFFALSWRVQTLRAIFDATLYSGPPSDPMVSPSARLTSITPIT